MTNFGPGNDSFGPDSIHDADGTPDADGTHDLDGTHDTDFEAKLRELLADDAGRMSPGQAPYSAIVHEGQAGRRRRAAAMGVGLAALVAVPGAAYAVNVHWDADRTVNTRPADSSKPAASPSASVSPPPSVSPSSSTAPQGPATPGQLADGLTLERAAEALTNCIEYDQAHQVKGAGVDQDLGAAADYRIILALKTTGDDNAPGDGVGVVAVRDTPTKTRIICNEKDGVGSGLNISSGGDDDPGRGPVAPDINGTKLYQQTILSSGSWKLPYRWGSIGTVESGVAKVTVSYGGVISQAALDHGYFAATGILTEAVSKSPHIKGYDAGGKLVYDSDDDTAYDHSAS